MSEIPETSESSKVAGSGTELQPPNWKNTLQVSIAHMDDDRQEEVQESTAALREEIEMYVRNNIVLGTNALLDIIAGLANEQTHDSTKVGPKEVLIRTQVQGQPSTQSAPTK